MDSEPLEDDVRADGAPDGAEASTASPRQQKTSKADRLERKAARLREAEQRAATGSGGGRSGWWFVAAGVVIVGLAVALAVVMIRWNDTSSQLRTARRDAAAQSQLQSLRDSALSTAQKYAVDFGSYDYANLDQDFQLVSSHLTKGFAAKYEQISQQLKSVIVQYKGKSTAKVQGAGIESFTAKQAVVVLFLDQTVTTTQSKQPRVDRNRLTMTLQRQADGGWLISDLALV